MDQFPDLWGRPVQNFALHCFAFGDDSNTRNVHRSLMVVKNLVAW